MEKEQLKALLKTLAIPVIMLLAGIGTSSTWLEWLASVVGIITVVPLLVEAAKVQFELSGKKWWFMSASRWLTFGFSIILVYVSYYLDFGIQLWLLDLGLPVIGWLQLLVFGFMIGLTANGWFKIEWIEYALAIIFKREEKIIRLNQIRELKKAA